jgi:cold shock CspA family protein
MMPHGTVTRVEPALGFGWIVDDAGMDWFFVRDGVRAGRIEALTREQRVTFTFEWTNTGPRATDIAVEFPRRVQ